MTKVIKTLKKMWSQMEVVLKELEGLDHNKLTGYRVLGSQNIWQLYYRSIQLLRVVVEIEVGSCSEFDVIQVDVFFREDEILNSLTAGTRIQVLNK